MNEIMIIKIFYILHKITCILNEKHEVFSSYLIIRQNAGHRVHATRKCFP